MKTNKLFTIAVVSLVVAHLVLFFVSWFLSARMVGGVRSLISAEGMRWFCEVLAGRLAGRPLSDLLFALMAWGTLRSSGLLAPRGGSAVALWAAAFTALLSVVLLVLFTSVPGAVLLSATGHLWPSPFSRALVPLLSLAVISVSAVYGWFAQAFTTLSQILRSLCEGIVWGAPLLLLYILSMQLYLLFSFVFL